MAPLPTNLRRDLERAIIEARKAAERGARAALGSLTVGDAKVGPHLDPAGRILRNRLRAHARQLGDARSARGEQAIVRLAHECAYEHWHRMLFARFLAENDLLIEPQSGVSVSLDDVQELAREQGVKPWPLAASFAQRMLPQIFRTDDPVLAIDLPTETLLKLESLLEGLSPDVFTTEDALGWTYQFWQSAEKDTVNDRVNSGEKITGETLPAVTQLFTEHYMVLFLLHNTIGAWHACKSLTNHDREGAASEHQLRDAVRLAPAGGISGYDFEYLRFVREPTEGEDLNAGTGPWRPAAGTYDAWPKRAAELRILDPCCGSGHFLVAAFDLLVRLRMAEEGLDTETAIKAVLADNLFGLELDARCTQIAAFNLALAAWKVAGRPIDLPTLNIACSGIGPQATNDEWLVMADDAGEGTWAGISKANREFIRNGLTDLHATFSQAPELGSLIDPTDRTTDLITADYEKLRPFLDRVLAAESDDEAVERAVAARGMAAAAEILARDYTLVITNVPYLARGKHGEALRAHLGKFYNRSKQDLATAFLDRYLCRVRQLTTCALVLPHYWLFLQAYSELRRHVLGHSTLHLLARLGANAFETISGEVVNVCLLVAGSGRPERAHAFSGADVSAISPVSSKSSSLAVGPLCSASQAAQLNVPDFRITFENYKAVPLLSDRAQGLHGQGCFDVPCFVSSFWEVTTGSGIWELQQTTPADTAHFGGCTGAFRWERGDGLLRRLMDGKAAEGYTSGKWRAGVNAWGAPAVAVSGMSKLVFSQYVGRAFDENVSIILPRDARLVPAIWAYCESGEFERQVRKVDQKFKVTCNTLVKVPFDADRWNAAAVKKYPNGLPEPQSVDPTQWLFHGRPERADIHAALQVAVARLVGYRWPAELDADMRLAPEARALVERCTELAEFADEDGIVCLSPLRGESSAADRLRRLLAAAFGSDWSNAKERELLAAAAEFHKDRKSAVNLDEWLRESFFEHHCKLFHHRPFVWHIWDGRKDGFNALVNYHRLTGPDGDGRRTLEALTYSYLGDWIQRQQDGVKSNETGAEARLAAAMELKDQLEKILAGEPPYDIFVRWKPLHEQPIGWEPDINDGVRLNIRPFMNATLSHGKKGAGVLRWKPNIKWGPKADRGSEPEKLRPREMFPWFWGWDEKKAEHAIDFGSGLKDTAPAGREFDGNRWNDLHYTNAAKQAARERVSEEVS